MNFKLALAQYPIHYYNSKKEWSDNTDTWFKNAKDQDAKILVFPEYGSMELISLLKDHDKMNLKQQIEGIQTLHNDYLNLYKEMAIKHSVYVITPSFPIKIETKYFNRAYLIAPSGKYDFQDKIHMTRFEDEWGISESETELKVFEISLGRIAIQTCFDIEFPWASALLARENVSLILAPSCTEGMHGLNRVHIGARARALENQIYVGVSQVVGNAPWSLAIDISNGYATLYCPIDNPFPENGTEKKGILNTPTWVVAEVDFAKLEKSRIGGQVENFRLNSSYHWQSATEHNLKLMVITL